MAARKLVDDYLDLCRNPAKDVLRWLKETDDLPGVVTSRLTTKGDTHVHNQIRRTTPPLDYTRRLCSDPLHSMHHGMDAHRDQWRSAHGVSSRPSAGTRRYDELRSLRAEQRADITDRRGDAGAGMDVSSELAAAGSYFAGRLAAARTACRPGDVAAAIRTLENERVIAMRAIIDRWKMATRDIEHSRKLCGGARRASHQSPTTSRNP